MSINESNYALWCLRICAVDIPTNTRKDEREKLLGFIDSNPDKQGKYFCGLPVMSFEEAIQKYDEQFDIYITANEKTMPNIIGFLLENNIAPERILNYEPVEKRLGCRFCETQLIL